MAKMNHTSASGHSLRLAQLLNRVRMAMLAAVERELGLDRDLAPLDVTSAQFIIVSALSSGTAKSAADLCKEISYDAGAMTRMIDRLEYKGLLQRSRQPNDRRLVNLELTERAIAAMPSMRYASMRVLNRFLRGFSREEARKLEELLTRMLENGKRKM
jgi:DNA-binding MarR family transcriptional regulator